MKNPDLKLCRVCRRNKPREQFERGCTQITLEDGCQVRLYGHACNECISKYGREGICIVCYATPAHQVRELDESLCDECWYIYKRGSELYELQKRLMKLNRAIGQQLYDWLQSRRKRHEFARLVIKWHEDRMKRIAKEGYCGGP